MLPDWSTRFNKELEQANAARIAGNEGMARVCARRAAGIAVGEYLRLHGLPDPRPSAYDRLRTLLTLPGLSVQVSTAAEHLLLRINTEHQLPTTADLLADARLLARDLLA